MPYIKQERRDKIQNNWMIEGVGELNYKITKEILAYMMHKIGETPHKIVYSYADYNEVIGVLECVKQEFYRRMVALYEDEKREENGDVF